MSGYGVTLRCYVTSAHGLLRREMRVEFFESREIETEREREREREKGGGGGKGGVVRGINYTPSFRGEGDRASLS